MSELWANNAKSTLSSGITNSATSITVADGSDFPSPTGPDYFWATLDDATNIEIVKVTARSTNTMTVTRAQQGTTGFAFSIGSRFELRVTKETLEDLQGAAVGGDSTHTDLYASRPAASNAGDLFFPSDSFYVERDTGAAWAPWGPIFAMTPPVSGDFAWINQGSATVTTTNGGIYLFSPGSGTVNLRIRKKAITAPYTVTAYVMVSFDDVASSPLAGLCFRQSSDGKIVNVGLAKISNVLQWHIGKYTNETTWSGANYYSTSNPLAATIGPGIWIRIVDDNANRVCSYSLDGQNFRQLHTIGRTDFMTADEVGFFVESGASTSQQPSLTLLSWKQ